MIISRLKLVKMLSEEDKVVLEEDVRVSYFLTILVYLLCVLRIKKYDKIDSYTGTLDGNGHTISTLDSLFHTVESDATVKNLTVEKSFYFSNPQICIINKGTIKNVTVNCSLIERDLTDEEGGIVKENQGKIIDCNFTGSVKPYEIELGLFPEYLNFGGIALVNNGIITDCTVSEAKIVGNRKIGGIVSINKETIKNCEVINTKLNSVNEIGGIVGINKGKVENCTVDNLKSKNDSGYSIGGISGKNERNGNISNSIIKGQTDLQSETLVGGISGSNKGMIQNSKVHDKVSIKSYDRSGMICAECIGDVRKTIIAGDVVGSDGSGGLIGTISRESSCKSVVFEGTASGESGVLFGKIEEDAEIKNCHTLFNHKNKNLVNVDEREEEDGLYDSSNMDETKLYALAGL